MKNLLFPFLVGFVMITIAISVVSCQDTVKVTAYELESGNSFSGKTYNLIITKNGGGIMFATFEDQDDNSYPVYKYEYDDSDFDYYIQTDSKILFFNLDK